MEGFCSILAGLWGSGAGSTTLTENVHTIDITKVASRRAVEVGAVFLILFSFMGKCHKHIWKKSITKPPRLILKSFYGCIFMGLYIGMIGICGLDP